MNREFCQASSSQETPKKKDRGARPDPIGTLPVTRLVTRLTSVQPDAPAAPLFELDRGLVAPRFQQYLSSAVSLAGRSPALAAPCL